MPETLEETAETTTVWADVVRVCERIPPLWDLRNYVAVNPFLGFASHPVDTTARIVGDGLGANVLPGLDFYRARWAAGEFGSSHVEAAARRAGRSPQEFEAILAGRADTPLRTSRPVLTFAERHDREHGTEWSEAIHRSIARWCAVHATRGGSYWSLPENPGGLYASWRESALSDHSLEIAGLAGFRAWISRTPESPSEAITEMLERLEILPSDRVAYLYRLLGSMFGWASYFRREGWQAQNESPGAVADLLAILICADAGVAALAIDSDHPGVPMAPANVEDEATRLVLQDALEDGFAQRLLGNMKTIPQAAENHQPSVQAIFCIDVRSEVLRRHLEAESPTLETRGFAGFFGVALDWQGDGKESARCPVLLRPGIRLTPTCSRPKSVTGSALLKMQSAPAAAFSFVEILGIGYGLRLASDALITSPKPDQKEGEATFSLDPAAENGVHPSARLDLAAAILKNMGFGSRFARLVLLCGHEGHSANNPHAAGLDCGACGGHGGAINARVAAAILNDPAVRAGLPTRGWNVPGDTHFLPGVHDTSTDTVRLLDTAQVPAGHRDDLARLRLWLDRAGQRVREERATALGLGNQPRTFLDRLLRRRARDWSEVRPEWALARNAAFIAARRGRTRGVDLAGRAFLHEYDASLDLDGSVLALILSAPMVVASWINLQYFASTVDNRAFGAGDKTLHNRVGSLGVVLGNGGDLRTGLPLQSVHESKNRWFHEPLRLQVVVEARRERIEQVLNAQPGVRDLVENGWVRLFALDPDGEETHRWIPGRGWEEVDATP